MKRNLLLLLITAIAIACHAVNTDIETARALAKRLSPQLAGKIEFKKIDSDNVGTDVFTLESKGKKIVIGGNDANSMAVGLNRYLNRYCHVTVSWYADIPVVLPQPLPQVPQREVVKSRVPTRFFLNYCTFGYTMPFWDWNDWERFIDWMALNGINMPLAITGQEAVWYKVWTRMGMTDEEVRSYFTGPVYLPWHRMANIDAWCGPLPKEWLDGQTVLQQKILARERALNMRPVLPAFAGHVPKRIKELFPDADIVGLSTWDEFEKPYRTYFLNSEDPLYEKIQKAFLQEQEQMFGTDHIYGIDPFNEMDPPSFEPEYLHNVTKHIYRTLTAADPQAEWLQMGWFLYYQRKDYTPQRARAMLTGVPQGKMTMLDYYCEFKEMWRDLEGFYGQPYVWCYLGNFGGNSIIQGNVKTAGQRLEKALAEGGSNLVGIGSTLEGLEVQQFPYEYIFEKAWTFNKSDEQVIDELALRHAGVDSPAAREAWQVLYDSVLNIRPTTFCGPLPCSYPVPGKEHPRSAIRYNQQHLLKVWDLLLQQEQVSTDAMTIDLIWVGRQLLGDMFYFEKQKLDSINYAGNDDTTFKQSQLEKQSQLLLNIIAAMDDLNSAHPFCTLDKWIEQARDLGIAGDVKDYYEMNARRLVTTWGGDLNDYSCRNWAGLLNDYYRPRWSFYIDEILSSAGEGRDFDLMGNKERINSFQRWWPNVTSTPAQPTPTVATVNVLELARSINKTFRENLEQFAREFKRK